MGILIHQHIFSVLVYSHFLPLSTRAPLCLCLPLDAPSASLSARPQVTVSCKTVVLSFAFLAEERGTGEIERREGRGVDREGEREGGGGVILLSSCLLAELRACLLFSCACKIAQVALYLPPSLSLYLPVSSPS